METFFYHNKDIIQDACKKYDSSFLRLCQVCFFLIQFPQHTKLKYCRYCVDIADTIKKNPDETVS